LIELNKIYNMDCIDGMKLVDDNSIDLIITSPPYNAGIQYDSWNDNMSWQDYLKWVESWLSQCFRILKDDGRICINHYLCFSPKFDNEIQYKFPLFDIKNIMDKIGFNVVKLALWDDRSSKQFTAFGSWCSASSPNIQTPIEGILIGCKKNWKKESNGTSTIDKELFLEGISGIWDLGTTVGNTIACFPEKLPYMCIQLLSYENDVVFDPFSGSGTTCYVAKNCNRKYLGFEISKNYYENSLLRMNGCSIKLNKQLKNINNVDLWGINEINNK